MKYYFTLTVVFFWFLTSFGQIGHNYNLNFEDSLELSHLTIDKVSNPENIWQVGHPQKQVLTQAKSLPNVIITDTVDSYPINNTSTFLITNIADYEDPYWVNIYGDYFVFSDSLTDYGKIEFSGNKGKTWIDLLNDSVLIDTPSNRYWSWGLDIAESSSKPVLTGFSGGWKFFETNLRGLAEYFKVEVGDTLLYKFSFISDSIQTDKDGLMFDNFGFRYNIWGIEEKGLKIFNSSSFPNPARNKVTIEFSNEENNLFELTIVDLLGKEIISEKNLKNKEFSFSVKNLKTGLYHYKLVDKKGGRYSTGKFIKD